MNILGINLAKMASGRFVYDGAAALLANGNVSATAEERLNRQKYSGGYQHAVDKLLERANLGMHDIHLVVASCYGEEPKLELFDSLGFDEAQEVRMIPSHHLSHAYSAFFPSNFNEALVIVADNEGSVLGKKRYYDTWKNAMERVSVYRASGNNITRLEYDMDEENLVSLGEVYSAVTHFLGFESYQQAGKTMALAAYGDPAFFGHVPFISCLPEGRVHCNLQNNYLDTNAELKRFLAHYGFDMEPLETGAAIPVTYQHLAAAIQDQLEKALMHKLAHWNRLTGIKKVCFSGGIALNCVAIYRVARELALDAVFVPTNPGDQGLALGNVLYGWHEVFKKVEKLDCQSAYLGFEYDYRDCVRAVEQQKDKLNWFADTDLVNTVARELVAGKVIALYQGRSEWGPRALGNRSILADPRRSEMKDYINEQVKHRENFRPFAPVACADTAGEYFDVTFATSSMTVAVPAKQQKLHLIPAVVHIDGTARLQTVTSDQNPFLFKLIKAFGRPSGVEVLLNTSFNDNGEPVVETPVDAVRSFLKMEKADLLLLGSLVVRRN